MTEARDFTIAPAAWDPDFAARSSLFEPLRAALQHLPRSSWPTCDELDRLARAEPPLRVHNGLPVRFVPQPAASPLAYETRAYRHGEVQMRAENWHDLFNALVWRTFPRTKAALNRAHYEATVASANRNRGPRRDALTVFDESGVIVVAHDAALLELLREFRWHELFWRARERVCQAMRFVVFGHALYEKALRPYIGLTGHAVLVPVNETFLAEPFAQQLGELDAVVAARLQDGRELASPRVLAPLPVLGVPGWWPANEQEAFYRNTSYFRPGRRPASTKREER